MNRGTACLENSHRDGKSARAANRLHVQLKHAFSPSNKITLSLLSDNRLLIFSSCLFVFHCIS